jgi:hypothetical protein
MIGICKSCSKEYKYFDSQQSGHFCSKDCSQDYRVKTIIESGTAKKSTAVSYLKRFVDYKCSSCGIDSWNGKPITLQIEHKDGNPKNNTIENICWLCPNCHTQTDTWGSKNCNSDAKKRMSEGAKKGSKSSLLSNRSHMTVEELENLQSRN